MPKTGEKKRKLRALASGQHVRPPKKWFDKLKKKLVIQYPENKISDLNRIVGGIWAGSSKNTQKKIIKKYQV